MKKGATSPVSQTGRQSNAVSGDIYFKRKQYKRKRKTKAITLVCVFALIALIASVIIVATMKIGVVSELTVEAGCDEIKASDFFKKDTVNAFFVSGGDVDTRVPGVYKIRVRNGAVPYNVTLTVADTVPPTAKVRNVSIVQGEKAVTPLSFLTKIEDETQTAAVFKNDVDLTKLGDTPVTVVLSDAGGNETVYNSILTVFPPEIIKSCTVEAGTEEITVKDFLAAGTEISDSDCIITDMESVPLNKVASNDIEIMFGGVTYTVQLNVEDTRKPSGYIINQTTYRGTHIPASDFIRTVYDETEVDISYSKEPDFSTVGAQIIGLVLKDEGNNVREYKATLYVNEDKTPPIIHAPNRTVYFGDNIRFSDGVTATDNNDGEVPVSVDASKFDKTSEGEYPVVFTAEDSAGNKAQVTAYFILTKKPVQYTYTQQVIEDAFNALYNRIIKNNMTAKQKMRAIYNYVRENIQYTGTSEKGDWEQEAYRTLKNKEGDSYSFYAISRKLLTMAGIENQEMQRKGSDSFHYWNKVLYDGVWYHFDTCPHYKDYPIDSFMLTDEEAEAYSQKTNGYYSLKENP